MKKTTAFAILVLLLLAAGCSPQPLPNAPTPIRTLYPATLPAVETRPPATGPAQTAEPGQGSSGGGDVAAGKAIFDQNCTPCHNLTAETKVGPGLAGLFSIQQLPNGKPFNEANLSEWIHTGGGGMPAFGFNESDTQALIAYLKEATQ